MKTELLITSEQIKEKVAEIGRGITNTHRQDECLVLVGLLSGAFMFMADLIRRIKLPTVKVRWLSVNSYVGVTQLEKLEMTDLTIDKRKDIGKCSVVIVDEIYDTGKSISFVHSYLEWLGIPKSRIEIAVLLSKRKARPPIVTPKYVGFHIEDVFVVGYGLDYDGNYRGLDEIRVLDTEQKT